MHRARGRILSVPEVAEEDAAVAQSEEIPTVVKKPEPLKLRSTSVSVPEPSRSKVRDGMIQPYGGGRTRSSSGGSRSSTGSLKSWLVKDVWRKAELYLTDTTLCYAVEDMGVCELLLEDVLGIQVLRTPLANHPTACEFNVHLYIINNPQAKKKIRMQCTAVFHFDSSEQFVDNLKSASEWKTAVLLQTQRAVKVAFGDCRIQRTEQSPNSSLSLSEEYSVVVPRKFLVFINPMAGSQKGVSDFKQYVQPMFDIAEINYVIEVTKYHNHAREMIKTYDLTSFDGIVISSGDGLLYEIINGIMEREDWDVIIKIPIGMLPTGSGNALCASTLVESDEEYRLETAAFQIIRGGVVPMDLATIQLADGTSSYMALLANWGIVADIDIESEKFRRIGKTRFILGALTSIVRKKIYRGKLSYITADESDKEPERLTFEHEAPPPQDTASRSSTEEEENDGKNSPKSEKSSSSNSPALPQGHSRSRATSTVEEIKTGENVAQKNHAGPPTNLPPTNLLVPLTEPVPDSWTTREDNYLSVTPLLIPMMSSTFFGDKDLAIGGGNIHLMWVDGNISRMEVLNVVSQSETGKHVDLDVVFRIDVKAFRLEPLSPPGIMTLDGEKVTYGPMQGQVHPGLARVMSRRRRT